MPSPKSFDERFGVIEVLKRDEGSVVGWAYDRARECTVLVRRLDESVRSETFAREALEAEAAYTRRLDSEQAPSAAIVELEDGESCLVYEQERGVVLTRLLDAMASSGRCLSQAAATVLVSEVLHAAKAVQRVRARALTGASLWGHGEINPNSVILGTDGIGRLFDVRYASTGLLSEPSRVDLLCRAPEFSEASPTGSPAGDVYAVGAVLSLCVLGTGPLVGHSPSKGLGEIVGRELDHRDDLEDGFGFVLTTALSKRSRERFENSNVMRIALRQCALLSKESWQHQVEGLAALAKIFSVEDAPREIPDDVLSRYPEMTVEVEQGENTIATLPSTDRQTSDVVGPEVMMDAPEDTELLDAMGQLGLPGGTPPRGIQALDAKDIEEAKAKIRLVEEDQDDDTKLNQNALAVLDEVSESNLKDAIDDTDGLEALNDEKTKQVAPGVTASLSAPAMVENHGYPEATIRASISDEDTQLEMLDPEMAGETTASFESVTDEVEKPDLDEDSSEQVTMDATSEETAEVMKAIKAAHAAPTRDMSALQFEEDEPVEGKESFDSHHESAETTDLGDLAELAGPAGLKDDSAEAPLMSLKDEKTKGKVTISRGDSVVVPLPSSGSGPIADEFDNFEDEVSGLQPIAAPVSHERIASVRGTPVADEEDESSVPSLVAEMPELKTGPLLAEAIEEELARASGAGSDHSSPLDPSDLPVPRGHLDLPRPASQPGSRRLTTGSNLSIEELDPDVKPIELSRAPRRHSSPVRAQRVRPPRPATLTRPPPRFEAESSGGRLAFMALAAVVLGVGLMFMLAQERRPESGAVVGTTTTNVTTTDRTIESPRLVFNQDRELAEGPNATEVASARDIPVPSKADRAADAAARRAYGETDPLDATGRYDPSARRDALGVWRLDERADKQPVSELVTNKADGTEYEDALAYAPAYVPADRFNVDDDPYGGDYGAFERDIAHEASPYIWGGPTKNAERAGRLIVNVIPWGNVFIDDRSYGYPPVVVRYLAAGPHTIRVQRPGFDTVEQEVVLGEGEDKAVHIRFKQVGSK